MPPDLTWPSFPRLGLRLYTIKTASVVMHEGLQFDYTHSHFDSVAKQMENRINNSSPVLLQQ